MNELLISDLHLSSAVRDAYRFDVFKRVREVMHKRMVTRLWILGDLTDAKDYHSGQLVNRICDELNSLAEIVAVLIVRGNHDGVDSKWPFFQFLSKIPHITFYTNPQSAGGGSFVLPHSRDPQREWAKIDFKPYDRIYAHATFRGVRAENDVEIGDAEIPKSARNAIIYSGDVHVPQQVKNVVYVGSPHPVHYGDKFKPRMLYLKDGAATSIELRGIRRLLLDVNSRTAAKLDLRVNPGDQAKIRLHLEEAELGQWLKLRKEVAASCKAIGLDVASIELVREKSRTPLLAAHKVRGTEDVVKDYIHANKTPNTVAQVGLGLVRTVKTR